MTKFIVSDPQAGTGWTHIFAEDGVDRERMCRFVFDAQGAKLIHLDVMRDSKYREASPQEIDDLSDSLISANAEALEDPEAWGLSSSQELPEWADSSTPSP